MSKHCPQGKAAKTVPFFVGVSTLGHTEGKTGSVHHGLILEGGHNITLKEKRHHHECATVKINARDQSVQTQNLFDVTLGGNTAGIPSLISSGTMILAGGNNITLSQMGNAVIINGPNQTQNQSGFDLTLSGNTSGTLVLISSGTLALAGGNNITLSQNGNAITISAGQPNASAFTAGMSDIGNTSGTTGVVSDQLVFAGGNNITLSQSINGQSGTITISAQNQSIQTENIIQDVVIEGNTSGTTADISSGTLILVGGNNITLSQDNNTITISSPDALRAGMSNLGNIATDATTALVHDQLIFVGGNNITLRESVDILSHSGTITIDAQSQSLQTRSIIQDVNIIGNTSGTTADITSGTLYLAGGPFITLSQDGNSISISGRSQENQTASIIQAVEVGGNTSGTMASISSGTLLLVGGYNITLSQDQNTITMSGPEALTAVVSDLGNTAGLTGAPTLMDKLIFVGGNNITLSQTYVGEDVTITIDAQSQSIQTQGIIRDINIFGNTTGTTADITSGTLYLAGGNDITLSQDANSITISMMPQSQQTQNIIRDVSIGGSTSGTLANITSGTLFLAGGNNIVLSQNQNSITISGPDELYVGVSNIGNTSGTTGLAEDRIVFVGGNNVTLIESIDIISNSATITISAANQSIQTASRFNLTLDGNTSGTLALVSSGILTLAGGNNITLSQVGNAITISAPADVITQFSAGMSNIGNTSGTTGLAINQLVLAGGNQITLSGSTNGNSMTITISGVEDTVPSFSGGISAGIGNTIGTTGFATERLILAGGNNITLSGSTNAGSMTVTVSARNQSVQTQNLIDVTVAGNTSGTLALISSGTLILAGGNNITLSQDGNAITISAFQDFETQFTVGISDIGNTSGNTGTFDNQLVLVGGNNITLSQSMNGQSGTITISAYNQTVQTQGLIQDVHIIGNTSGTTAEITSGTLSLAGGDNITLSQNGNAITISAAAVGAGSFTAGMSNLGNTAGTTGVVNNLLLFAGGDNMTISQSINGQSATMTFNFATIGAGSFTAGMSNLGNTSGTSGVVQNELVFAGGNNITLSQSVNGQNATLTISAQSQSLQTGSIIRDVNILGNTSGTTADITSGTLYIAGGSNITLFQNVNSITINAQSQSQQTQNIIRDVRIAGNTSGTLADISSGTMSIAGGYNVTISQNQNSITISGGEILTAVVSDLGNTAGLTGAPPSGMDKLIFVGGNNITLSQTYVGENVTITIDGPADTISMFTAGMSNLGNTDGTTGLVYNQLVLVGGNEITLSQSINGQSATVTIVAAEDNITQFSVGISNLGNFAGTTGTIDNQIVFVGGNNVTLSQSIGAGAASQFATLTIHALSQSVQTGSIVRDVNIIGNTSGTTVDITSGTLYLAGGNNVTLSQNGNTITISAFNQTVQTQNMIDVTIGGNTTGTLALISSGTLTLAGGNNIVLSQDGNAVTISVSKMFLGGVSNLGNTSGTTGVVDENVVFVGGNNVTLIQSRDIGNNSATITISARSQSIQTQNIFDLTLGGNTSGTLALVSTGTMTLAGGNNITLSQIGNGVTINAQSQSIQTQNLIDVTLSGNTSGTLTIISSGTMTLAGGANITLSQAGNVITISGANQTFRGQMSNLGNTAGTSAGIVSSQLVLVGGNNITLSQSVNAGSATLTINALSQSIQTQTIINDVNIIGNTDGVTADITSGTLFLAGGDNITLSQNGNSITVSGPNAATIPILSKWENVVIGDTQHSQSMAAENATFWLVDMAPGAPVFPGNMTVSTMFIDVEGDGTVTAANSHTLNVGIYTRNVSTLSLLNSVRTTWGFSANTNNTRLYSGIRFITINSSLWSTQPTFSQNNYYLGFLAQSAGNSIGLSIRGNYYLVPSDVRFGTMGVSTTAGNTSMGQAPFVGMSTASRTNLPVSIQLSELRKSGSLYGFLPHMVLYNVRSNF